LLGFSESEQLNLARIVSATHVEDRGRVERSIRDAAAGQGRLDLEHRLAGPDGAVRWVAVRGNADNSNGARLIAVVIDVTARKGAELQAEKARAELRHMSRVSLLGQLSASIAHQLNQPLAAILGNAEAARKMLGRDRVDLVELREICSDIVSEDHRASQVIRRLGDLYRRNDTVMEPLDLNELVIETLALVRNELNARHVTSVTELASAPTGIKGGRVQLQQVLLNLVLNAADAMSEAAPHQRTLSIRTGATAAGVSMSVVDNGPGIAADDVEHVFDAFWTTKKGGMGMGLALCQSIVAAHRGTITAANNADGGATFCVTLPIGQES
jgi:C4-dicarboxylate-specific signal transduction histidine kinase